MTKMPKTVVYIGITHPSAALSPGYLGEHVKGSPCSHSWRSPANTPGSALVFLRSVCSDLAFVFPAISTPACLTTLGPAVRVMSISP